MTAVNTSANVSLPPPSSQTGVWGWVKGNLLSSPLNMLLTALSAWLLLLTMPGIIEWAFVKAHFAASPTAEQCRADTSGACWTFIIEKHRLILFGTYPYEDQWRPLLACIVLIAVVVMSGMRRFWNASLALLWAGGLTLAGVLMWGGVFGLSYVEDARWGGLPITLVLSTFGIALAFPLGVLLALGRSSRLPAIKAISVAYIELIRGVPLISLLFMASLMLPLFLPEGFSIDKLLRAQIAIIMFSAAYIAEVVRGGLQSIPKGQYEGADSLGLTYWQQMRKIILPQALRVVIPPLVSIFISLFKDTSLVVIIGIFDLILATKTATADAAWGGFHVEGYIFIGVIYFVFCYWMSKYSQALENRLSAGYAR